MFPDFNRWSLPLLILVLQGLIFAVLLISKYKRKGNISDLFLGLMLFISCYSQTCYTLGFMGWYDAFRETKINYFLLDTTFVLGPLIFFYLKSITTSHFMFKRKDWWHFAPALIIVAYHLFTYTYDAMQPGFETVQHVAIDEERGVLVLSAAESGDDFDLYMAQESANG